MAHVYEFKNLLGNDVLRIYITRDRVDEKAGEIEGEMGREREHLGAGVYMVAGGVLKEHSA